DESASALDSVATADAPPSSEHPGTVIGPYKLLEQIGEGGMGTVWMAEQRAPVKRVVALKVIKAGMDSRQVLARFGAERQALALMDHPNIAKVLDAGATDQGRPYFVMELVKGVPITRYCDEKHLTPRERLELFIPVCQAAQHAHQKGIIHRDLKPSNVVVGLYDGQPIPKIIDFGVAKAAGPRLTEATLFTGFGTIIGTPEYMSPEQAQLDNLDIDTRSDIYSLGVLLYELLTGTTPFTKKDLDQVGLLEMLRVIREQEPTKPSTKLSTAEGLPTLAANRGTEPARLTKLVRGDLDRIVMKAREKDRNCRYETANGLVMDVERYLADEPVQACPPSAAYRFRKFVRRNKAALVTVGFVAVALLLGTVVSVWQAVRASNALTAERATQSTLEREREETERQKSRINRDLSDALVETISLREKARAAGPGHSELWAKVREAARQAHTLAGHELADPSLVQRVQTLQADWRQDEIEPTTLAQLEEIRLDPDTMDKRGPYLTALRKYGLPILDMNPDEASRKIAASPIRDSLVIVVDELAVASGGDKSQRLLSIARQASDDPWRQRYFDARLRNDKAAIRDLAKQPETLRQPPAMIAQLVGAMKMYDNPAAKALCRQGLALYPSDLWLNRVSEGLGIQFERWEIGLRISLALRPESPNL